jgi:glycerol-3-phosphate acyltransferase PlsX
MSIRIAVDTMGGDRGPAVVIDGALQFLAQNNSSDTSLVFVGPEEIIRGHLKELRASENGLSVVDAREVITMDDTPKEGIKKRDSSLVVSHRLLKEGKADAVVSTGNSGAIMASAMFNLGRIEGVSRPAIAAVFPTSNCRPSLVLDVGANSDCKVHNLLEFAHMGAVYYSYVLDVENPKVALLSIGEESSKGNDVTVEAHRQLGGNSLNFIGNVEGRDILTGKADVVVCDGFVGNIILKFAESIKPFIFDKFKRQVSTNLFSRLGAGLMAPFLGRLKKTFDYSQAGGAPLLGTNGVTIVSHGSSNALAVMNAVRAARDMVEKRVNGHIISELSSLSAHMKIKGINGE